MTRRSTNELPPAAWDTEFEPYAMSVGFMLRAWNDLQERFATLFVTLIDAKEIGVARAAWYAVPNDRFQRKMVCEAARYLFSDPQELMDVSRRRQSLHVLNLISWAVQRADNLGYQRDTAAHAPVAMLVSDPVEFIPREVFGNPIALRLKGKKLLQEFALYRERATVLHNFVSALNQHLREPQLSPLPKKPVWPESPRPGKNARPPDSFDA